MQRRVFRYELTINDEAHEIPAGKILHLGGYHKNYGRPSHPL